jgi:hypothetical protein
MQRSDQQQANNILSWFDKKADKILLNKLLFH